MPGSSFWLIALNPWECNVCALAVSAKPDSFLTPVLPLTSTSPREPTWAVKFVQGDVPASRVNICITPPSALLPYKLETFPRTTSMRSTLTSGMCSKAAELKFKLLIETPSTRTRVWRDSAPLINALDTVPTPPF